MTVLMCPPPDAEPWPTLGPFVCDFIERELCHGPGDLFRERVQLNDEQRAWIYRMYEVGPPEIVTMKGQVVMRSPNPRAGRRRFQRCALSLRKGTAKTEMAAWIAAAELHHEGPVRCAGFESVGGVLQPIPRPVLDPYIPMISYAEEQTEELAYGALRRILEEMPIGNDFDIGLERIMRRSGAGKAEAVSATPNARDGARTTFQHADETHRFTLDKLKDAWTVMRANMAKRPLADPWALETTTAPEPGAGSVAESTMEYARSVMTGKALDSQLFFYHRQAADEMDITTRESLKAAIVEASGPYVALWSDVDRIAGAFDEPDADRPYLERVWLNRLVQSTGKAFSVKAWQALKRPGYVVPAGAAITLGFDGSRFGDATALVGCELATGFLWPLGVWPAPNTDRLSPADAERVNLEWVLEIDAAVRDAFERWHVCRLYADPPLWETWVAAWAGRWEKRVFEWWTNRRRPMAYAIRSFVGALSLGELSHDGSAVLEEHIGNARQQPTGLVDEQEKPLWLLRKERPESPKKIDAAVSAVLAWEARNDAIAAGEGAPGEPTLYFIGTGTR